MAPEAARYAALRKFGNVARIKEQTHEVWCITWLEQLLQDIRYGVRILRKTPVITAIALLSLALGIGANTAIFSLIDAVMLRMLPVQNPERLALIKFRFARVNSFAAKRHESDLGTSAGSSGCVFRRDCVVARDF